MDIKQGPLFLKFMGSDYKTLETNLSIAESNLIRKNVANLFRQVNGKQVYSLSLKSNEVEGWVASKIGLEFQGVHWYMTKYYTSIKLPPLPKSSSADQNKIGYLSILGAIINAGRIETAFQKEMLLILAALVMFESKIIGHSSNKCSFVKNRKRSILHGKTRKRVHCAGQILQRLLREVSYELQLAQSNRNSQNTKIRKQHPHAFAGSASRLD
jgi:hypothetical protein